jgi:hypothetical protein
MTQTIGSELCDGSNSLLKKKKGLQYDIEIDRAIFQELNLQESLSSGQPLSSGQLKKRIEKLLGRKKVADTVYYDHINKLVSGNDLEKKDTKERGRQSVFYSLNKEAKRTWRLNIHRINAECVLFRQIYERLFFYEFQGTPAIIITDQDFDKLLQSEFNTTRDKLNWGRLSTDNHLIVEELYGTHSETKIGKKHRKDHNKQMQVYWTERGQVAFEEVVFLCQPLEDNLDVWIIKTEYWEINKNSSHKKYAIDYRLQLPGVAINEFMGTENFKREDLEKATSLLIKEGLLTSCMVFRDETRYKILDERLRYMIEKLRGLHYREFNCLLWKWEDFEEPTNNEKERSKWLEEQDSERIFRSAEMMRYRNKLLVKTSKTLEEYRVRYAVTISHDTPLLMTAEKYKAILNGNIIPHFEESMLSMYEHYKSDMEKKGLTQSVLGFHAYRRERLTYAEADLAWDAENLKRECADILEEYKFLHNAIRMICPLVFQPPDPQLQIDTPHYDDRWDDQAIINACKTLHLLSTGKIVEKERQGESEEIFHKVY